MRDDYPNHQRQYVVLLHAWDVLIEHNRLSEGGRIKAGRPGRRIVIQHNTLHNINDNGITVVVTDFDATTSEDFLIAYNTLFSLASGIFFGTDGQAAGEVNTTLWDVTVHHNTLIGDWTNGCITGVLPNHAHRVYVGDNVCHKYGTIGAFSGGIVITKSDVAPLQATDITVERNFVTADTSNALAGAAAIFVRSGVDNLCLLENTTQVTGAAIPPG